MLLHIQKIALILILGYVVIRCGGSSIKVKTTSKLEFFPEQVIALLPLEKTYLKVSSIYIKNLGIDSSEAVAHFSQGTWNTWFSYLSSNVNLKSQSILNTELLLRCTQNKDLSPSEFGLPSGLYCLDSLGYKPDWVLRISRVIVDTVYTSPLAPPGANRIPTFRHLAMGLQYELWNFSKQKLEKQGEHLSVIPFNFYSDKKDWPQLAGKTIEELAFSLGLPIQLKVETLSSKQ